MAISDRTRKLLWGHSGNRCAICNTELIMNATDKDDEAIVGDECHIVARENDGPRGDSPLDIVERDKYPNLLLLCRIHHKLIDDQPNTFPVEKLQLIKALHEKRVREALSTVGTRKQRADTVLVAQRIETGQALLDIISGSHAHHLDKDDLQHLNEVTLVGGFLQTIEDYVIFGMTSVVTSARKPRLRYNKTFMP